MKKLLTYFFFLSCLVLSCENDDVLSDLPSCIQSEIESASQGGSSEASLTQYRYNGQVVYSFNPGIVYPDMMTTVVNEDCEVVCWFGGFAGTNTCPDFVENAEVIGVIWRND
ncbi:hypothetical protein BFP97_03745 [Roseivirga sp. 4D4]|uniref:DUF6970 domain-containing protein n=1 Tax=Roseivirga sp. 4D4 TaxID=1889784 RepID=UPI000853B557|nr:hypothetical protein [Roseivirga sp. 4D4]OEK00672.1 hypothetical protein BFP97_03745 [Roseivirga sp. 4D4]